MSRSLRTLREDLAAHKRVLEIQLETLARLEVSDRSDEDRCVHAAATLTRVYTALENVYRAVASTFDEMPIGDRWHRDLLSTMCRETGLRPAVTSAEIEQRLAGLLEFRHYFIHGSVISPPQGARVAELRADALSIRATVVSDLERFDAHLEKQLGPTR